MVDLIVGKRVEGKQGTYYVREAGEDAVYEAEIVAPDPDNEGAYRVESISSHFIDWVEANPFDLEKKAIRRVAVDNYTIDADTMTLQDQQSVAVSRADAEADWSMAELPEGKQIATKEVDKIVNRVTVLRLADVAQRLGLGAQELVMRGFFPTQQGLFGKQGAIRIGLDNGLSYHLFFGEIAGTVTKAASSDAEDQVETGLVNASESDRLMFVFLGPYDPTQDETLPTEPQPSPVPEDADEAKKAELADKDQQAREAWLKKKEEHIAEMKERVEELNKRFTNFFYIIRDGDFQTLRPDVERLVEAVPEPEEGEDGQAGESAGGPPTAP